MRFLTLFVSLLVSSSFAQEAPDAVKLLHDAEASRGVLAANGLQWTVDVVSQEDSETDEAKLVVKTQGPFALAEILEPDTSAGKKYLVADGDMWFSKPGTRAVPINKRMQLAGRAAIGEIASSSFMSEYNIAETTQTTLEGEACTLYELEKKPGATYAKVLLWVSNEERVSRQAHFYTITGKHIRSATFEHKAKIKAGGNVIPFLSGLVVTEMIGSSRSTLLSFSEYKIYPGGFPDSTFDRKAM
tara:strand:+ start:5873 stop:6604 length:732 start_codon:yes stop_codon:yes gene_type:complete